MFTPYWFWTLKTRKKKKHENNQAHSPLPIWSLVIAMLNAHNKLIYKNKYIFLLTRKRKKNIKQIVEINYPFFFGSSVPNNELGW